MNCILAGVGGQGTVLASKLIAQAGLSNGLKVRTAETIGMAQRGGSKVRGAVWNRGMAYLRCFRGEAAVFRYAERTYVEGTPGDLLLASVNHGVDWRRCDIADRAGASKSTSQIKTDRIGD